VPFNRNIILTVGLGSAIMANTQPTTVGGQMISTAKQVRPNRKWRTTYCKPSTTIGNNLSSISLQMEGVNMTSASGNSSSMK
jgi:hypothetical protein